MSASKSPLLLDAALPYYIDDLIADPITITAIAENSNSWSTSRGNQKVLKLLTARSAVKEFREACGISDGADGGKKEPLHLGELDGKLAPLHLATIHRAPDVMEVLVVRLSTAELNVRCAAGRTPLSYAVENGDMFAVRLLLERLPADQLAVQDCDGRTPMHHLVQQRKLDTTEVLRLLLERLPVGCLSIQDSDGCTPLHLFVIATNPCSQLLHQIEVFELLLGRLSKSQLALRDRRGRTVLHHAACKNRSPYILNMLLPHMAAVVALQDLKGDTPSHLALGGCAAAVPRLLRGGTETQTINSHILQFSNSKTLAGCLTPEQLNITNQKGETPADLLHDLYHPVLGKNWLLP